MTVFLLTIIGIESVALFALARSFARLKNDRQDPQAVDPMVTPKGAGDQMAFWSRFDLKVKQILWLSGENHKVFSDLLEKLGIVRDYGTDNVAGIEEITASVGTLDDMTATLKETTLQLVEGKDAWHEAFVRTESLFNRIDELTGEVVQKTHQAQGGNRALQSSAGEIDRILGAIRDISKKTRLLALNASIEAARAGDAGRGFAVVAEEITKLSTQTEEAIVDVEHIVGDFRNRTSELDGHMVDVEENQDEVSRLVDEGRGVFKIVSQTFEALTGAIGRVDGQTDVQRETVSDLNDAITSLASAITDTHDRILGAIQQTEKLQATNSELTQAYDALEEESRAFYERIPDSERNQTTLIGINPFTSPAQIEHLYGPILREILGEEISLFIPKSYDEIHGALSSGQLDLAWLSPLAYVSAKRACRIEPMVSPEVSGKASYHGYILTREQTPLPKDIGRFGFVDEKSASGYLYAKSYLDEKGHRYEPVFLGSHDRVIEALLNGEIRAGATYDEAIAHYGPAAARLHTQYKTPPIPKDAIVFNRERPGIDEKQLADRFTAYSGTNKAKITGFVGVGDADYEIIRSLDR